MSIVLYLGRTVKEYKEISGGRIKALLSGGTLQCELCLRPMRRHSSYVRGIAETGEEIEITMVWCRKCKNWHALLPDFLLPNKHYSGNEVEDVIIASGTESALQIETKASESTVLRWIREIGEGIGRAIGIIKYEFLRIGSGISEIAIDAKTDYGRLEQILEMAPREIKYSGNKLGLANIWLGASGREAHI